jgi:ELWxxDGT repeat protein
LYFNADDTVHGAQLWTSNGNAAGTHLVDAIDSPGGSYPDPIGALNRKLLFLTYTESQNSFGNFRLWTTNGAASGTALLTSLAPNGMAAPYMDGKQVFFAGQVENDVEPWVSNGTASGTHVLKDIDPSGSASPFWFESFWGMTLFAVDNSTLGEQLWQSNGTNAGTMLVADIPAEDPNPSPVTSAVHRLGVGRNFFFAAHGTTVGTELYVLTGD